MKPKAFWLEEALLPQRWREAHDAFCEKTVGAFHLLRAVCQLERIGAGSQFDRTMSERGMREPLSPGMNITDEIKTEVRQVFEFLLSPVQRAGSESLRER